MSSLNPNPQKMSETKLLTKKIFNEKISICSSICLLGHVSPDGDCIGSTMGIYNYIKNVRGGNIPRLKVHLSDVSDKFSYLPGFDDIDSFPGDGTYDLAIVCDSADVSRLGKFKRYMDTAGMVFLIDHHETNAGFGDYYLVKPDESSASEVAFSLMDQSFFDKSVATCIYTGLVHDTGVFRFKSTHKSTMEIAGLCIERGVDFGRIIEDSFFSMTIDQKRMLGNCLIRMQAVFNGMLVYTFADSTLRDQFGGPEVDMDGMIDVIRSTMGALAVFFLYPGRDGRIKASLRSNTDKIDVSRIAIDFGGGGHKRAAGCFMSANIEKDIADLILLFKKQFISAGLI